LTKNNYTNEFKHRSLSKKIKTLDILVIFYPIEILIHI